MLVSSSQKTGGGLVTSFPTHQYDSKAEAGKELPDSSYFARTF